jgi:signal transduction histidine kinase
LALYTVLLILPAVILGTLHYRTLRRDHRSQLAAIPTQAEEAAWRLARHLRSYYDELLRSEAARPFYQYRDSYFPEGTLGTDVAFVPSPLAVGPPVEGVRGWFCYSAADTYFEELITFGAGRQEEPNWPDAEQDLLTLVHEIGPLASPFDLIRDPIRLASLQVRSLPLPITAINLSEERDIDCLLSELPALRAIQDHRVQVQVYGFELRVRSTPGEWPSILFARRVLVEPAGRNWNMPACFGSITRGGNLIQGFMIDSEWLFQDLPIVLARAVLDNSQELVLGESSSPSKATEWSVEPLNLASALGLVGSGGLNLDIPLSISVDMAPIRSRLRDEESRFLVLASLLALVLTVGVVQLLRSVGRDLERARETENFVAAVTHELRTPLSAIRMHGEMLRDGWVESSERQREYYERILAASGRLETLVDRILEKRRLGQPTSLVNAAEAVQTGSLNERVAQIADELFPAESGGRKDLVFQLEPNLPQVILSDESLRSILANLVENARKYAPVAEDTAGKSEPILVSTRPAGRGAALEVADRGPGIPAVERERIFEPFYRIGDEATRTAQGTGLGLHLVHLQARSMEAKVSVEDRPGGGTLFRVTFAPAES